MNAPPTFESFILFDGEKKITQQQDLKVPNAMIFTINKVKSAFLWTSSWLEGSALSVILHFCL